MSKVTKITIGRVFNLGNYEHVRYEVQVEIPETESADLVFLDLEQIIEDMNPKKGNRLALNNARVILAKPASQLTPYEREDLNRQVEIIADEEKHEESRKRAIAALKTLGGEQMYVDAKQKWEDEYDNQ